MPEIDLSRAALSPDAAKLVGTFLRFEFALKDNGLCPMDGDAAVDWGTVTASLRAAFFAAVTASGNANTILTNPPKKQIVQNRHLNWQDEDPPRNTHELFVAVRRVRNNLVHGGKAGDPESDPATPDRNLKLIREAQWVVEAALLALPQVQASFEGRY